jgi:hypothetical protein
MSLVGAEIAKRRMSRDSIIYKLSLLGWTQEEIGKAVGIDFSTVSGIFEKFNIKLFKEEFERGDKVEDIAKHNQTDQARGQSEGAEQFQDFAHQIAA